MPRYETVCELPNDVIERGINLGIFRKRGNRYGTFVYLTDNGRDFLEGWLEEKRDQAERLREARIRNSSVPADVQAMMPDPTISLCPSCISAYRNGHAPGETACEAGVELARSLDEL